MRSLGLVALALVSCSRSPAASPSPPPAEAARVEDAGSPSSSGARLTDDTLMATVDGHSFTAPAGWSMRVRGRATIVTAPEGGSHMAFVGVHADDAAKAVAAAWVEYGRREPGPAVAVERLADHDGWTDIHRLRYQLPPNGGRFLVAEAGRSKDGWLVTLVDMSIAVFEKREAQVMVMYDGRLPKGYTPESFAGRPARLLDDARVAELAAFVETARAQLDVPGVSLGVVQDGEVVLLGGFGVRELGKPAAVDADTRFMIGSTTKPLTTLMLAKLVDEGRISWDSPATSALPAFKLGSAETTAKVQVKHLLCACTGLPRQDLEWSLEFGELTPQGVVDALATMQPTSEFGALYQYSNPLAAVAGFLGGHVAYPRLELGAAYDEAMRTRVFEPLGMKATTFDASRARRGNWARPHERDIDGRTARADDWMSAAVVPIRPAGGAWSTARDMLAVVRMELAEGRLPGGARYLSRDTLLARREPQVAIGKDGAYGMGLQVVQRYGVTIVQHGGVVDGYYSNMMWLPEHGVGAVALTNGAPGWAIHRGLQRKLLELLFDGEPRAAAEVTAEGEWFHERLAAERERLDLPADVDVVAGLAPVYESDALGEITVRRRDGAVVFDFGEWKIEVTSTRYPDGTVAMVGIPPSLFGIEFVVGRAAGRRTLTLRDNQHEYVFVERAGAGRKKTGS
ncbi:MAG: beta-lactamase family protein [Myxococcales bacterium]|nr:beta-lactamase family protein [Myxococcales bacterium]